MSTPPSSSRREALATIAEIAAANALTVDDIAAALASGPQRESTAAQAKVSVLTRLLAYLGGVFVFAGLGVFIAMQWDEMNSAARVVATLGSGLACFVIAFVSTKDERLEAAVTPLNLIAAVLQPFGLLVVMDEYSQGGDWHDASLLTAGVMLVQQVVAFAALRRTVFVFNSILFGVIFFGTLLDRLDAHDDIIFLTIGVSLLCVCVGVGRTRHAAVTTFWYLFGAAFALWALFDMLRGNAEPLFLGAACAMVYLSTAVRSRSVLLVATLAILGYIGYYTERHFVDRLGWPIALMGFGFVLIGLSVAAVTISRRYIRAA